jgi:hypothetical protein
MNVLTTTYPDNYLVTHARDSLGHVQSMTATLSAINNAGGFITRQLSDANGNAPTSSSMALAKPQSTRRTPI